MARVTIEDCITHVPSRFELVIIAAQRAKEISAGAPTVAEKESDKNAVTALRELAAGKLDVNALRESVIKKFQRKQSSDSYSVIDKEMTEDQLEIADEMKKYQTTSEAVEGMSYEDEVEKLDTEAVEE